MQTLKDEIIKLSQGNEEQIAEILDNLKLVELQKGDFILKAGQVCKQYYFIESGSVRLYYHKGDNDFTVWIGTSGQIFTDLESYLNDTPSRLNFEAIEKSKVLKISKADSDKLAFKNNAYNTLLRRTVEISFVNLSRNVISFQSEEASERYERIEKEKNWIEKYPFGIHFKFYWDYTKFIEPTSSQEEVIFCHRTNFFKNPVSTFATNLKKTKE